MAEDGVWVLAHKPRQGCARPAASTQYQPRYHWQAAYYTDGSVCSTGTGSAVGAGVYSAEQDQCFYINTNGQGQEDTMTRAELAALHYTVTQLLAPPQTRPLVPPLQSPTLGV